jgi:hypothetical protein
MLFYAKMKKVIINPKPNIIKKIVLLFFFTLALAIVYKKRSIDALLLYIYKLEDNFNLLLLV